jgi:DNA-binding SARP family transcriptional activator/pimeloyl-ACP methyl ester carboxylesterase
MLVRLLGPVDVVAGGVSLPVNGLRRKAVLAVLALQRGVVSSDRLAEVVWGGEPPATPLNTVQRHVSYLRQVLGSRDVIVARPPGYLLDPVRVGTDVAAAERLIEEGVQSAGRVREQRLRDALALWRGRPLADVDGLPWLREEGERLEQLRLRARRELVETLLALGEHARLLPELEALSSEHPFDEQVHAQLMVALYRSGRQADALGVYRHLRRTLAGELGIEPVPTLRDLEAAILRQDRALDLVPAAVPLKATARKAARPTPADTPPPPDQESSPAPPIGYAAQTARGMGRPPAIRYCATPAGRVAYSTSGAGPALLFDSGWITHLRGQLELCAFGDFLERLGEFFTVIRYDKPGCGLSDRDGTDLSFDGQVAAALAVADAVGARRFHLFGASQGGQLAAAIAARYPERVEALVVYGTCASGRDLAPAEVRDSLVALVRAHWGLGQKALSGAFVTDPTAEEVATFYRFEQVSSSAAVAARLLEVYYDTDIRALLPAIATRTAVLHREADMGTRFKLGREVAALIPGATLIPLPGSSHLFYHGDWLAVLDAALGFLCEPASPGRR